jgi:hypothetical protein
MATKIYENTIDKTMATPAVWGPHLWKSIHYIALGYPAEKPTDEDRANYKAFYTEFYKVIPCIKCAENYKRHLSEVPAIDGYLGSSDRLFEWTWMLHNTVNRELGKKTVSLEEAKRIYMRGGGAGGSWNTSWIWFFVVMVLVIVVVAAIIFWWQRNSRL